jgi:hypothetical protein
MSQILTVDAKSFFGAGLTIPVGSKCTATISGSWKYDPGRQSCGAAGNGTIVAGMPNGGAPQGCCLWLIDPLPGQAAQPQDVRGWFTSDNQKIVWGGTTPGDGAYRFSINDDNLSDNSGALTITYDIEPR